MTMPMIVTSKLLDTVYQRINSNWLVRHGLDRFNRVVFRDGGGSLLVCLQRPELRNPSDLNNFIVFKDGLDAYSRYAREFSVVVRYFLVDESFDWRRVAVPTDNQILGFGRSEGIETIRQRVQNAGSSLLVRGSETAPVFFIDEKFQPIVSIGYDPDLEPPPEAADSPLMRLRRKTNRTNDNNAEEQGQVELQLSDGQRTVTVTIDDITIDELLVNLSKSYHTIGATPF